MRRLAPLALVLAVAAVAWLILSPSGNRRTVIAEFSDVRGVAPGAQVRLAGVPVGQVQRIWLGPDGWPRVAMSIDTDVSPARAAVRLVSLSSEWGGYISIVQGPWSDFIPRSRTTSPVEVDQALSTFDPATETALHNALGGLRTALSGRGPALAAVVARSQAALAQLGGLADDLSGDGAALQSTLRSSQILASTLAQANPELTGAVDHATLLLRTLAQRADATSATLGGLPAALGAAQDTLWRAQVLIPPATRLVSQAAPAMAQLPAASNELRDALNAASPSLDTAAQDAALAPSAATATTPVLRAAGPLLRVMIPVLRRMGPMLDQLRVRLPDAFSFFANWADFTSNFDANGHAARVGIVLPPAPTNTLSPDSNGPGQLAPPYLRTPGSLEGQPWGDYANSFVAPGKP
jgi:phospholipid/cholesterol/gamma-HCH transport system substrate-binding protein